MPRSRSCPQAVSREPPAGRGCSTRRPSPFPTSPKDCSAAARVSWPWWSDAASSVMDAGCWPPCSNAMAMDRCGSETERATCANRFAPEAWLDGPAAGRWSFNHFSNGPQRCPGDSLAVQLGTVVAATILAESTRCCCTRPWTRTVRCHTRRTHWLFGSGLSRGRIPDRRALQH